MWRFIIVSAFALFAVAGTQTSASVATEATPAEIAKVVYDAANRGAVTEMVQYIHPVLIAHFVKGAGSLENGLRIGANGLSKNGQIKNVEIVKEDIQRDKAVVIAKIVYNDGSTLDDDMDFEMLNGKWLVFK